VCAYIYVYITQSSYLFLHCEHCTSSIHVNKILLSLIGNKNPNGGHTYCLTYCSKNMSGTRKVVVLSCHCMRVNSNGKCPREEVFYNRGGEWHLFDDPHGLSQSTTIFKAFMFPYEFIPSSLPHKFKPNRLSQRRKKKHLHKHMRPRKRLHFKRRDFINVICNRFRLPLWFNRFQRQRKKVKLVKIHCKNLTKPMNESSCDHGS